MVNDAGYPDNNTAARPTRAHPAMGYSNGVMGGLSSLGYSRESSCIVMAEEKLIARRKGRHPNSSARPSLDICLT